MVKKVRRVREKRLPTLKKWLSILPGRTEPTPDSMIYHRVLDAKTLEILRKHAIYPKGEWTPPVTNAERSRHLEELEYAKKDVHRGWKHLAKITGVPKTDPLYHDADELVRHHVGNALAGAHYKIENIAARVQRHPIPK